MPFSLSRNLRRHYRKKPGQKGQALNSSRQELSAFREVRIQESEARRKENIAHFPRVI